MNTKSILFISIFNIQHEGSTIRCIKGKIRKSSESVKKMALQSIYMQCRETEQQDGNPGTRCTKIETRSDPHQ